MHCWHQAVRVRAAEPGDRLRRHRRRHRRGARGLPALARADAARPSSVSPDGTRRPYWLLRPLKPRAGRVPAARPIERRAVAADGAPARARRARPSRRARSTRGSPAALGLPAPPAARAHRRSSCSSCRPYASVVPRRRGHARRRGARPHRRVLARARPRAAGRARPPRGAARPLRGARRGRAAQSARRARPCGARRAPPCCTSTCCRGSTRGYAKLAEIAPPAYAAWGELLRDALRARRPRCSTRGEPLPAAPA